MEGDTGCFAAVQPLPLMWALPAVARLFATLVAARGLSLWAHEMSHLACAMALGYGCVRVDLHSCRPSVSIAGPPSKFHAALIRTAGWVASVLLAAFALLACASMISAGDDLLAVAVACTYTACEALQSDLLSAVRPLGIFYCGNFGLLLLQQASANKVEHFIRRMTKVTMMRGAQSAGLVTYRRAAKEFRGSRYRVVNGKRTDLSDKLMQKARGITTPKAITAPALFQGHTRFATSSIADFAGCHPHQWTPRSRQRHWRDDMRAAQRASHGVAICSDMVNVEAYITHNGDLDFFEMNGVGYDVGDIQWLLAYFLDSPVPGKVDSLCVAGLLELLRTRGLWLASVRYGYIYGALKDAGSILKFTGLWTRKELAQAALEFEKVWTSLVREQMDHGIPPGGEPVLMSTMRDAFIKEISPIMSSLLTSPEMLLMPFHQIPTNGGKTRSTARLIQDFVSVTVDAFLYQDLYTATRQLLANAKGSFGLVTSHSLDASEELVVAARGQTQVGRQSNPSIPLARP